MLKNIHIQGYRCFRDFRMERLARVNLLVGKNNSGKTTLLEAVEALTDETVGAALRPLRRRSEIGIPRELTDDDYRYRPREEYDPAHLFTDHQLTPDSHLFIEGDYLSDAGTLRSSLSCQVNRRDESVAEQLSLLESDEVEFWGVRNWILRFVRGRQEVERGRQDSEWHAPLTSRGTIRWGEFSGASVSRRDDASASVEFVTTGGIDRRMLSRKFDAVVLTELESIAMEAMKIISPEVDRAAFRGEELGTRTRNALIRYRATGDPNRPETWTPADFRVVPMGSFGDGLSRLLAISLSVANARGGFLLIDEIDTGLHYTTLTRMWKLVIEASKQLNVQAFATTHSLDCIRALARVCEELDASDEDVLLHRLEREGDSVWSVTVPRDQLGRMVANDLELR